MSIENIQIIVKQKGEDLYKATDGQTFTLEGPEDWITSQSGVVKIQIEQQRSHMYQSILEVPQVLILPPDDDSIQLRLLPDYVPPDENSH